VTGRGEGGTGLLTRLDVGCSFTYLAEVPTPVIFEIQPDPGPALVVTSEKWTVQPFAALHDYEDLYGNPCVRTVLPAGRTTARYSASVDVPEGPEAHDPGARETPPQDLPDPVLLSTLPSRYCLPDMLADEAGPGSGASHPVTGAWRRSARTCTSTWVFSTAAAPR
jgi:hypothetical protein